MDPNTQSTNFDLPRPVPAAESTGSTEAQPVASAEAPHPAAEQPQTSPLMPQPQTQQTSQQPANQPQQAVSTPSQPLYTASPAIADDVDLIEKEWVVRAKQIVAQTKEDPFIQTKEINKFKADYIKKRYNKDIKVSES